MLDEVQGRTIGPIVLGLNTAFLDLFRRVHPDPMGLNERLAGRLVALSPESSRRLAALPCVLFGFGLAGNTTWDQVLDAHEPASLERTEVARFLLIALSSMATIAAGDRDTAAVRFGVPERVLRRLVEGGPEVALQLASRLDVTARFGTCGSLWGGLISAASRRRTGQFEGLQVQWVSLSLARAIGITPARDAGQRLYRATRDRRRLARRPARSEGRRTAETTRR
jgi:hypothetical protein